MSSRSSSERNRESVADRDDTEDLLLVLSWLPLWIQDTRNGALTARKSKDYRSVLCFQFEFEFVYACTLIESSFRAATEFRSRMRLEAGRRTRFSQFIW
jgi:hypothetical protein